MGRVDGKVALVAGAGGGIGGAGAEALGARGCAAVVCADIDGAAARRPLRRGSAPPAAGRSRDRLDVRDRTAVDAAVAATVREFGRLDVLVDCAGSATAEFSRPRSRRVGARHRGQSYRHVPSRPGGGAADGPPGRRRQHHQRHLAARRGRPARARRLCRLERRRALADPRDGASTWRRTASGSTRSHPARP